MPLQLADTAKALGTVVGVPSLILSDAVKKALTSDDESDSVAHPAARPDLHGDLPGVPSALGSALRAVHNTSLRDLVSDPQTLRATDCWEDVASRIQNRIRNNLIAPDQFPEPYSRYGTTELWDLWVSGQPPHRDADVVLCIGDASMDNLRMAHGKVVGCASTGEAMIADRHLDLARMQMSVQEHLGNEAVFGFYESYGSEPGLLALDHYVMANLLLGHV